MRPRRTRLFFALTAALLPVILYANAGHQDGPPIRRTGAAVDGGLNCTACHTPGASLDGGRVQIDASGYEPGKKQVIRVRVEHPESARWGFELTARLASDPSKKAGTFTATDLIRVRCDGSALRGTPGPCTDNQVEFAAHVTAATTTGSNGKAEFMVQWTPPTTNVGKIVLYAAGNAANGNGNNQGDRIYTTSKTISYEDDCSGRSKPTITGIINAASGSEAIGWNSMITIFGTGFAESGHRREAGRDDFGDDGRFPRRLECISVYVDDRQSPITYVSDTQINAQAPALTNVVSGNVRISVRVKSGESELASDDRLVRMQVATPAFFTFDGKSVAALHSDFSVLANPSVVASGRLAKGGEVVLLFGTGFGVPDPFYQEGEVVPITAQPRLSDDVTVTVGGVTLSSEDILYAGLSPGSISGLYQLNVRLPASLSAGDVPVVLRVRGLDTQAGVTIPVAP